MLRRRRVGQEWEYGFFHPLIHDVVYHSLLPEDRASLHEKTGIAMESMHSDHLDDYTDMLAHHYGNSDNIEKALHYLTLAGDKACELKSYWEALDYYGMAMKRAEVLTDEKRKKQVMVDLVLKRTIPPRHFLGCLEEDVEELERYLEWAEELGDVGKTGLFYMWLTFDTAEMGEHEKTMKYIKAYNEVVDEGQRSFWVPVNEAVIYRNQARYEDLISFCRNELAGPPVEQAEERRIANFQGMIKDAELIMGRISWNDALNVELELLDLYIKKSRSLTGSYACIGALYHDMGEWEKAIAEFEKALSMSPSLLWVKISTIPLGHAYCKTGQLGKGIGLLERWKAYTKRVGRGDLTVCEYCLPLAEGYLGQGDSDKAKFNVDEALQIARSKGLPLHEAQAYRILGEINAPNDFPSAESLFSRSLGIMQRIKARNEEGITELSWGRACQQHGEVDQARAHLTRAEEIFEELGTTRYLEWTREAIAELEDN